MKAIKTIDMVRQIRDKSYVLTKDMSEEELISYFKQKADSVNKDIFKNLKKQAKKSSKPHNP